MSVILKGLFFFPYYGANVSTRSEVVSNYTISLGGTDELDGDVGRQSSNGVDDTSNDVNAGSNDTLNTGDAVDIQHILSHNHQVPLYLVTLVSSDDSKHLYYLISNKQTHSSLNTYLDCGFVVPSLWRTLA